MRNNILEVRVGRATCEACSGNLEVSGTIPAFAVVHRETEKNVWRDGKPLHIIMDFYWVYFTLSNSLKQLIVSQLVKNSFISWNLVVFSTPFARARQLFLYGLVVYPVHRCSSYFFKIHFNIIPYILDVKTKIYNQNICYRPAIVHYVLWWNGLVTINRNYRMNFNVHTAVSVRTTAFWHVMSVTC